MFIPSSVFSYFRKIIRFDIAHCGKINFSGNMNSTESNTTSNGTDNFGWTNSNIEMARMVFITIAPVLILFGSFGNIMSFIILRRGDLKKLSTCFYMSVLAVVDTGRSHLNKYLLFNSGLVINTKMTLVLKRPVKSTAIKFSA